MSTVNLVAEIQPKVLNERVLSTREPCTCENATLYQSFHRVTLSINWYITQNFLPTLFMTVLFRCSLQAAMFSILKGGCNNVKFYEKSL